MSGKRDHRIGHVFAPFEIRLDRYRVETFLRALGEVNPQVEDGQALPPTMLGLGADPRPFDFLELFNIPIARLLHGEQEIEHHRPARVGELLAGRKEVVDVFEKKGGALLFVVLRIAYTDAEGKPVCDSTQTLVVPQEVPS